MEHKHNIIDTDVRFLIDSIHRRIKSESKKITLMQNDHNSERYTFELPRYIEGHDMTLCNKVEVHYLNTATKEKEKGKVATGKYDVEDLQISPEDETKVLFSWLISKNATKYAGVLSFRIKFRCIEDDIETYSWNTDIYADIKINDGINADETFEIEYVDIIEQWKAAVKSEFSAEIDDLGESLKTELSEWEELESGKIRGEMTAYSAQWNQALSVERERIDNIVALPEGSTTGDAELFDIRIGADGVTYDSAGAAVREQIKNNIRISEKISCGQIVTFSPTDEQIIKNALITALGTQHSTTSWNCTDFINLPFVPLSEIVVTCTIHGNAALTIYDKDKLLLVGIDGNNISDYGYKSTGMKQTIAIKMPEKAKYIRLCGGLNYGEYTDSSEFKIEGVVNSLSDDILTLCKDVAEIKESFNKIDVASNAAKVLVIGDSISADYYGNYSKWVTMLIEEGFFPLDTTNSSIHATGFVAKYNNEDNSFITRLENIENKEDFELVIIFGGINDYIQSVPMGENETDAQIYFIPAVNLFFEKLINSFSKARIAVLLPLHTYQTWENSKGLKQEEYIEYIKSVSKKYHLPVLNLADESGFCPENTEFRNKWTLKPEGYDATDGVHPTEEYERKYLAPMIKGFLKNLL